MADTRNLGTWYNRRWLEYTGRALEQELGFGWIEGMHPDERQRCATFCQTAFDGQQKFDMEFRLRRADGTYGWIADTGTPRFTPQPAPAFGRHPVPLA
jgi:PAS domain S-box-containing protein